MPERVAATVESAPPMLRVEGSLRDALAPDTLAQLTTEDLAHFLAGRRWFGAKGGTPRTARVANVVPLGWDDGSFAIARLDVETEAGVHQRYQLPLAVRSRGAPTAVLASVECRDGEGLLFDAVEDAAFRRHLADAFARGVRFEGEGSSWVVEPLGANPLVVPLEAPIELGTAEQSNTSIRFADEGILKLFRKLEPGQNPDVEIGRFLTTSANFPYTPALFGVARFEDRDARGTVETTLSAMLQEFMPGSMDAWTYVVRGEERGTRDESSSPSRPSPSRPSPLAPRSSFARDARRLGEITRLLHEALASAGPEEPDFVAEPARASDVEEWARATERQATDALGLLERQLKGGRLPEKFVAQARELAATRDEALARVRKLADAVRGDAGQRIRHHGDYHLGQVLRTAADDFMIIDFEGEPARPLEERRRKHSALRDVAGMLRSFAYAGATIEQGRGARAEGSGSGEEWAREAREAFLGGYLESGKRGAAFLPKDSKNVECLISLFETEKAFYELAYELNNRPDWVWIPMRALGRG